MADEYKAYKVYNNIRFCNRIDTMMNWGNNFDAPLEPGEIGIIQDDRRTAAMIVNTTNSTIHPIDVYSIIKENTQPTKKEDDNLFLPYSYYKNKLGMQIATDTTVGGVMIPSATSSGLKLQDDGQLSVAFLDDDSPYSEVDGRYRFNKIYIQDLQCGSLSYETSYDSDFIELRSNATTGLQGSEWSGLKILHLDDNNSAGVLGLNNKGQLVVGTLGNYQPIVGIEADQTNGLDVNYTYGLRWSEYDGAFRPETLPGLTLQLYRPNGELISSGDSLASLSNATQTFNPATDTDKTWTLRYPCLFLNNSEVDFSIINDTPRYNIVITPEGLTEETQEKINKIPQLEADIDKLEQEIQTIADQQATTTEVQSGNEWIDVRHTSSDKTITYTIAHSEHDVEHNNSTSQEDIRIIKIRDETANTFSAITALEVDSAGHLVSYTTTHFKISL